MANKHIKLGGSYLQLVQKGAEARRVEELVCVSSGKKKTKRWPVSTVKRKRW